MMNTQYKTYREWVSLCDRERACGEVGNRPSPVRLSAAAQLHQSGPSRFCMTEFVLRLLTFFRSALHSACNLV